MSGTRLTLVFELATEPSTERATALIERWLAKELDLADLRPLKVSSVRIQSDGRTADGRELADRRRRLNLSQRELAWRAGVTADTVSAVEHGRTGAMSSGVVAVRRALAEAEAAR